jgi:hypothetical protein
MSQRRESTDWLAKILAYVDSPFKLIAIIIMAVVGFTGVMIYQNSAIIIGAYREQQKLPTIAEDRMEDAVTHLFKYTQAEVVAVFKVDPILGSRVLYRAWTREGRDKTKEGIDVGLFTANAANNRDVVALMAGEIPCVEYLTAQSEVGLWYIEKGMRYGCRISIPPEPGKFVGQITVGWKEQPADLDRTRAMLMIASGMLNRTKK